MRKITLLTVTLCWWIGLFASVAAQEKLPGFGPEQSRRLRGFGRTSTQLPPVISRDSRNALIGIRTVDRNGDGKLSRVEVRLSPFKQYESRWFGWDLDSDGFLTRSEFAYDYARQRIIAAAQARKAAAAKKQARARQIQLMRRQQQLMIASFNSRRSYRRGGFMFRRRRRVPAILRTQQGLAAQEMLRRYDKNGDKHLDRRECFKVAGEIFAADTDGSGKITLTELANWLAKQGSGGRPAASGNWFTKRDKNRDGQVTMAEYAAQWNEPLLKEFRRYDVNNDGIITLTESRRQLRQQPTPISRSFTSSGIAIIEPRVGAAGVIRVDEDLLIEDINVRISASHRAPKELDAFLLSPSGKRVELFQGSGKKWKGMHLSNTLFDDEAKTPISSTVGPLSGSVKPESVTKKAPSLASLRGTSTKGVWRLFLVADRSRRAGLLSRWSLIVVPKQ